MSMENIFVRGIGITVTPALEAAVEKAASGIARMRDDGTTIFVKLKIDNKVRHKAEVSATCKGKTLRVEKDSGDMYISIVEAFDVLEHKMAKYGDKVTRRRSDESIRVATPVADDALVEKSEFEIVTRKNFASKPMTPEEACLEMELLDHNFFLFINAYTDKQEVVYKRNDGKYGLITINKKN